MNLIKRVTALLLLSALALSLASCKEETSYEKIYTADNSDVPLVIYADSESMFKDMSEPEFRKTVVPYLTAWYDLIYRGSWTDAFSMSANHEYYEDEDGNYYFKTDEFGTVEELAEYIHKYIAEAIYSPLISRHIHVVEPAAQASGENVKPAADEESKSEEGEEETETAAEESEAAEEKAEESESTEEKEEEAEAEDAEEEYTAPAGVYILSLPSGWYGTPDYYSCKLLKYEDGIYYVSFSETIELSGTETDIHVVKLAKENGSLRVVGNSSAQDAIQMVVEDALKSEITCDVMSDAEFEYFTKLMLIRYKLLIKSINFDETTIKRSDRDADSGEYIAEVYIDNALSYVHMGEDDSGNFEILYIE